MFLEKEKQLKEYKEKEEYPLYIKGIFVLEIMLAMLILPFIIESLAENRGQHCDAFIKYR